MLLTFAQLKKNAKIGREKQFEVQVKITNFKGWGLFAKESIPAKKFIIEYMGEVIKNTEFDQRFQQTVNNRNNNYYFLKLGHNTYIDASNYGNEARFVNHSCDANTRLDRWTVFENGQEQNRIGLFSTRTILPVSYLFYG